MRISVWIESGEVVLLGPRSFELHWKSTIMSIRFNEIARCYYLPASFEPAGCNFQCKKFQYFAMFLVKKNCFCGSGMGWHGSVSGDEGQKKGKYRDISE